MVVVHHKVKGGVFFSFLFDIILEISMSIYHETHLVAAASLFYPIFDLLVRTVSGNDNYLNYCLQNNVGSTQNQI